MSDRAAQLFGEKGADAVAGTIEAAATRGTQMTLDFIFEKLGDQSEEKPAMRGRRRGPVLKDDELVARPAATTLDRVHAAMLLQSAGRASALRTFLQSEVERGGEFLRLANALTALYPKDSEEKRLLDAMLLAVPK